MTRIKICGIARLEDALAAVHAGADALGFIAVPASPRYITPETLEAIRRELPPFISTVVVAETLRDAAAYSADYVQFYDEENSRPPAKQANRRIRVFRVKDAASLREIRTYGFPAAAYLLDTHHEKHLGGSGIAFDWNLAVEAKRLAGGIPVVLAGGLVPGNVGQAVTMVKPYGVDVSSGVESEPGRKDHDKIRRFITAVREADAAMGNDAIPPDGNV